MKIGLDLPTHIFNISKKKEKERELIFGHGFSSVRLAKSFITPGITVFFYQTQLYISELNRMIFIVIAEDTVGGFLSKDLFLFHFDLDKLLKFISLKIEEKQIDQNNFRPYRFMKNKRAFFPCIIPEYLIEKVQKKIDQNYFDFESNLEETYNKYFVNNINLDKGIAESMEPYINQFFDREIQKKGLPKMNIGDFFFGYYHPKIQLLSKLVL